MAGVLAVALVAGACGIPTGSAQPISKANVPFHLLDPTTTPSTAPTPPVGVAESIYLVAPDQQHLVQVAREVPVPASLADILGALLEGPTSTEQSSGIGSFVSGSRDEISTSITGGVATVNFGVNPVQGQVVGPDQVLAVAQIVYTATQPGTGASQVLFRIGGQAVPVPVAGGAEVSGPVSRFHYLPEAPVG